MKYQGVMELIIQAEKLLLMLKAADLVPAVCLFLDYFQITLF